MSNPDNELNPSERAAFGQLKEHTGSSGLRRQEVIDEMKSKGLLSPSPRRTIFSNVLRAAAVVLLLITGYIIGRFSVQPGEIPEYNYMLVLHESSEFNPGSPEAMFSEYSQWMQSIAEKGIEIDGQELMPQSMLMTPDGNIEKPEQTVGGYFILEASTLEAVEEIAASSPHLKYGGTIEIKKYMQR